MLLLGGEQGVHGLSVECFERAAEVLPESQSLGAQLLLEFVARGLIIMEFDTCTCLVVTSR